MSWGLLGGCSYSHVRLGLFVDAYESQTLRCKGAYVDDHDERVAVSPEVLDYYYFPQPAAETHHIQINSLFVPPRDRAPLQDPQFLPRSPGKLLDHGGKRIRFRADYYLHCVLWTFPFLSVTLDLLLALKLLW